MTKKFLIIPVLFSLLLCAAYMSFGQSNAERDKRDADLAWEALVRTKGGREKLRSIENMLFETAGETRFDVFPNLVWRFVGPFMGTFSVDVYDGKQSILIFANEDGETEVRENYPYQDASLERIIYLLETKWDKPELLSVRRIGKGKNSMDVLEAKVGDTLINMHFEPEELLIRRVELFGSEFQNGNSPYKIYSLSEYTTINGIKMPSRVGVKGGAFQDKLDFGYRTMKYAFNVEYDPKVFSRPLKVTTANAWKPKPKLTDSNR